MNNYIIRIYRRDADDPRKFAGMVEVVETEEKKAFTNIDELLEILLAPGWDMTREKGIKTRQREEK